MRLRSLAQELRSSSPGALGKGARRHEVCRRRYHCPVPGCPLNRSRRCTRSRVPPSASLCSRSCGCHFPLRRCALGARLIEACGPRHIKQGQPSSCKPTHAASRSHGRQPLTQEAESESADRVCRDGLKAAREAPGARRGDPRCQTILLARVPVSDRASLYDEITDKIIAELEAGRVPWVQPWGTAAAKAPLAMPKNAATDRQYSGVNVLILWGAVIERGFPAKAGSPFARRSRSAAMSARASAAPPSSMPTASCPTTKDARRRDRRRSAGHPVPQALHRLQPGSVRRPARRARRCCAAAAAGPDRAHGRGADQGERHRLSHRRRPRLLCAGRTTMCRSRRRRPISNRSTGTARRCMNCGHASGHRIASEPRPLRILRLQEIRASRSWSPK